MIRALILLLVLLSTQIHAADIPFLSEGMDYFVNVQGAATAIPYGKHSSLRPATEQEKKLMGWDDPVTDLYVAEGLLFLKFALISEPTEFNQSTLPGLSLDAHIYSIVAGRREESVTRLSLGNTTGNILHATVDLMDIMEKGQILLVNFNFSLDDSGRTSGFGKRKRLDLFKDFADDYSSATHGDTIARAAFVYLPAVDVALETTHKSIVLGPSVESCRHGQIELKAKVLDRFTANPRVDYLVYFKTPDKHRLQVMKDWTDLRGEVKAYMNILPYQTLETLFQLESYKMKDIVEKKIPVQAVASSAQGHHTAALTINYYILSPSWTDHYVVGNDLGPEAKLFLLDTQIPKLFTINNDRLLVLLKETSASPALSEAINNPLTFLVVKPDSGQPADQTFLSLVGSKSYASYRLVENGLVFIVDDEPADLFLSALKDLQGELQVFNRGEIQRRTLQMTAGQTLDIKL